MKFGIISHIDHGKTTVVNMPPPDINSIVQNNIEEKSYLDFNEVIIINAPKFIPSMYEGRQFICKGKHQYRLVGTEWICQCTRKI